MTEERYKERERKREREREREIERERERFNEVTLETKLEYSNFQQINSQREHTLSHNRGTNIEEG